MRKKIGESYSRNSMRIIKWMPVEQNNVSASSINTLVKSGRVGTKCPTSTLGFWILIFIPLCAAE